MTERNTIELNVDRDREAASANNEAQVNAPSAFPELELEAANGQMKEPFLARHRHEVLGLIPDGRSRTT